MAYSPALRQMDVAGLVRAYRERGDLAARTRLVEDHLPLVRAVASQYTRRGDQLDDLVQVGSIGLIKAIDRFEPERGVAFVVYAGPTIRGEISHYLRDRSRLAREHPARAHGSPGVPVGVG